MIYTMNGMTTDLWLQADEAGRYYGRSAHFSGDGFSDMQFNVDAVLRDRLRVVGQSARATPAGTSTARPTGCSRSRASNDPPSTFGLVDVDLFQRVVTQELPPGPGPDLEHHGAQETAHVKVGEH